MFACLIRRGSRHAENVFPGLRFGRSPAATAAATSLMAVKHTPNSWSLIDVFDRVLDKGIVIDAWVRMSLVGIDLLTVEARIVVASFATYLSYANALNYDAYAKPIGGRQIFVVESGNEAVYRSLCTALSNDPGVEIFYDRRKGSRPARRRIAERRVRSDVDGRIRRDGFAVIRPASRTPSPGLTRWTA
jgi:gas vesicle structural protein